MQAETPRNEGHYDLIVFGATGFVGKLVCRYLMASVGIGGALQWAVAGRSRAKLASLVAQLDPESKRLPYLIAEATDEAALKKLCGCTQVIISTVGPYALYGECLIKLCAETGTDYCDLTGEATWVRRMVSRYENEARRSGARLVNCCGFDSIPSDLGVYYLQCQAQERHNAPCTRVKMRLKAARGGFSGGTAASGINLVQEAIDNPLLQKELTNPYSLCPDDFEPSTLVAAEQPPIFTPVQYDKDFQAWVSPFIMAAINTKVVLRSSALLPSDYGKIFQYDEAILTGAGPVGWVSAQALQLGLTASAAAVAFWPTRWLLATTLIPAPGEGPSPEEQAQGFYDLRFLGTTDAGQTIRTKVTGDRDPGYGSTAKILGQAGICLALDIPKSAKAGGFWTPAALFGETLIPRLVNQAGLTFEVL